MIDQPPLRFGFAVKVLGQPGLKSNDTRRWQSEPHLRVSLTYLHAIFDYLQQHQITMYRMSSDVAPYVTHPDMPQFHHQLAECAAELAELGARARAQGLRLSFHPSQFVVLNSPDPSLVQKSVADLVAQAEHGPDSLTAVISPDRLLLEEVARAVAERERPIAATGANRITLKPR